MPALDRIGHSSGWDAMAGVVAVLFYPLRDRKVREIEAELNRRHGFGGDDEGVTATS